MQERETAQCTCTCIELVTCSTIGDNACGVGAPGATCACPLKALVWFWLIDETLSSNLVYQCDYEIGSTTQSDEAITKIMTMVMAW